MTPNDFVEALAEGGMPFADTHDIDYCPVHAWDYIELYHEDVCPVYEAKLRRGIPK